MRAWAAGHPYKSTMEVGHTLALCSRADINVDDRDLLHPRSPTSEVAEDILSKF